MLRTELIKPLHEHLRAHAARVPDQVAFSDVRRAVSYAELAQRTERIAGHLDALVAPGERVLICLGNCVSFVESYLAVARASGIGVPVNPNSTDTEITHFRTDSGAVAVITDPAHLDQIRRVDPSMTIILAEVRADDDTFGALLFEDLATTEPPSPARDSLGVDDLAFMLYTSGTTGRPKGVLSTTRNSLWTIAACYAPILGLSGEDRVLWPLPLHHCLGHHLGTLGIVAVGASAHVTSGFAPEEVLAALREGGYTFLAGVPAMYHQLLLAAGEGGPVSGLRLCLTAGAVASTDLRERFEARFGAQLMDSYGTTETCGPITTNWPTGARMPGSCGLPVPGLSVRLVDPRTGTDVKTGEAGQVWVQGPNVMAGYHNQPDATAEVLVDGWYRTGDLASRDDSGYLTVTGRIAELIIRGGENIYPAEIEQVLLALPDIDDAAVGPAQDELLGEVPVAYLVGNNINPDAIFAACKEKLSAFKIPVELRTLEALPRTTSGKVTRRRLADADWTLLARTEAIESTAARPDDDRASTLRADIAGLSTSEQKSRLLALVRTALSEVLAVSPADIDDRRPLRELGLTSISALVLRDSLVARTGIALPATIVFDHPTPTALATTLRDRLIGTVNTGTVVRARATEGDPIVIVGMACRLPGNVASPDDLWQLVLAETDATGDFPTNRGWDVESLYDPDPNRTGHSYTRRGGFCANVDEFDNELFGISPREALAMDPQQRLLLELAWETLENAGIAPDSLRGDMVGVFTGMMRHEYGAALNPLPPDLEGYLDLGKLGSVASGRISYALGLRGPALTVDTACSSALVALHLAASALRNGECRLALAGAATVMATPQLFVEFSRQGALSADGRCRSFAASADGTGWAEGAGLLLLERMSDARRNGHEILAVIRGSAVNSDGASNGLTAPNGVAQQQVIRQALANAGLSPTEVDAVEAHGTGTTLGDPIEAHALAETYGAARTADDPLWLGSLKSNIGHAQAAAGVAGIIKMVMAIRAGTLPRTLHVDEPSPHVDWETAHLALLSEARPWPAGDRPRRAGVSSFGISGTNAHVIIEQPAEPGPAPIDRPGLPAVPILLSGKSEAALRAQATRLNPDTDLLDLGFSLATTRAATDHRAVFVPGDLADGLAAIAEGRSCPEVVTGVAGQVGELAFVFPGQGSQWAGMATELLATSPRFRAELTKCAEALDPHLDFALLDVLREAPGAPDLDRVDVVQPVLFAVMVALARLWESFGVRPSAVVGHSQGELAAVCVAGGLDLADAARIIALRSKALRAVAGKGGMVAVPLPADEIELDGRLGIAAINGPRSTVVSGDAEAVDELIVRYAEAGVRARRIPVDYASHNPQMDQLRERIAEITATITPRPSTVRFYSAVTGGPVDTAGLTPDYWFDNLRQPVRFQQAVEAMVTDGYRVFVESSAHPVLTVGLSETLDAQGIDAIITGSLRRAHGGLPHFLGSVASLWVRGVSVDWAGYFAGSGARRIPLPTYAFQRERFWLDQRSSSTDPAALGLRMARHPLFGAELDLPGGDGILRTANLSLATHPWLADHAVSGTVLLPGTALVEMVAAAAREHGCPTITDLTLAVPVVIAEEVLLRLVLGAADDQGSRPVTIEGRAPDATDWTTHATGTVSPDPQPAAPAQAWPPIAEPIDLTGIYDRLAERGYEYGPTFQGLRALWARGNEAFAEVELDTDPGEFLCHPALLDAALQAIGATDTTSATTLPFSFAGVSLADGRQRALRVHIIRNKQGVEFTATDPTGGLVARIAELTLRAPTVGSAPRRLHRLDLVPIPPTEPAPATDLAFTSLLPSDDAEELTSRALTLAQTWLAGDTDARLVIVTDQAPVIGLIRSAITENPDRFALLTTDSDDAPWPAVTAAIQSGESELTVRDGLVHATRLHPISDTNALPDGDDWRLAITGSGSLADLKPETVPHRALESGEVRISIRAAGVNFRDVLLTLGMVAVADDVLGGEAAGIVTEVGPGVEFAVGDRVFGVVHGAFARQAIVDTRLLAPMPAGWTFAEGASVPIAFLTAYYGLRDIGQLRAGHTVLIHAAAGGVGMAAIALAKHFGAEVFATASPSKWDTLRGLGIPDDHIASSRDTEFEAKFRAATNGHGIDLVLNSLAGEFIDASLRLVAPGGRFVEIGKTDIRDPHDVHYQAFDLLDAGEARVGAMLAELRTLFVAGDIPLSALRAFNLREASEAFRFMSTGRHTGKIVLTVPRPLDPDGTVLITGGTGVLGGIVARHLVHEHGVRNLLLISRSGSPAPDLDGLANVEVVACDAADRDALAAVLNGRNLTAVFHAAGVLDDATIENAQPNQIPGVFAPKLRAALNLHELTRDADLGAFVLFSSIAGTTGGAGQGVYAAANVALDELARTRRAAGLPAVSIAWGMWAQASGMTKHLDQSDLDRLSRNGIRPMDNAFALGLLDDALSIGAPAVVGAALDLHGVRPIPPVFRDLVRTPKRTARPSVGLTDLDAVLQLVRTEAASVLGHASPTAIVAGKAFSEQGYDSLTAVELRNRLGTAIGKRLSTTVVFDHPTPNALAKHIFAGTTTTKTAVRAQAGDEPIAVIGMACRFPGGIASPDELWQFVDAGHDAVGPFPTDRGWDLDRLFDNDPDHTGTSYVREGAFLAGAGDFDAAFFGISPREALAMDPQQRLLLEIAWETFERAGIDPTGLRGEAVGVYAGQIHHDYIGRLRSIPGELEGYLGHGAAGSVASGRIAYTLGLEGPAVTVDTACSSSLVALHLAAQALRAGECTMALAGGVSIMAGPTPFVEFSRQRGLAADGRCKPFAEAADGTGWSEGVGLLLVEKLSDAQRNGHQILAVMRGSAVNQDGASNGLTAPNGPSQQRVISTALANAGLTGADVQLVEAHGTGTRLGDPIEAQALLATYGQDRAEPLWLGSIKSNIGHSQAAAGVAGLIKVIMAMRNGRMPQTLHVDAPSSHVDWTEGGVSLLTEPRDWPADPVRRAAVSSFGVSGTNAHIVLEAMPAAEPAEPKAAPALIPLLLSARDNAALRAQAGSLNLTDPADRQAELADTAQELLNHRALLDHRAVIIAADLDEARAGLAALADGRPAENLVTGSAAPDAKTVFVFPGQGAQWVGMARDLAATEPVFAKRLAECGEALRPYIDFDFDDVVHGRSSLDRVDIVQPALFAVMVSLAAQWQSVGVRPEAVLGHSQGEIAAACVAGILSLDDAARVVALRSKAIIALAGRGGMLSVATNQQTATDLLIDGASIAAINGPTSLVLAGEPAALDAIAGECTRRGIRNKRVPVDYASHTQAVEAIRADLARDLAPIRPGRPSIPMLSTVTGEWVGAAELDAEYWYTNLRRTVGFQPATETLLAQGFVNFVESSPHPVLLPAIGETAELAGVEVGLVASLRRDDGDNHRFTLAMAEAHVVGVDTDWSVLFGDRVGRRVDLPTYPFRHRRYWVDQEPEPDDFWTAVRNGDLETVVERLQLHGSEAIDAMRTVLRAAGQQQFRYRIDWQPVTIKPNQPIGRWLMIGHETAPSLLPDAIELVVADTSRAGIAELLAGLPPIDGVLSLLGNADEPLFATMHLIQAMGDLGMSAPVWHVTTDLIAHPERAAIWGLGRVIAAERPELWGGLIELDEPTDLAPILANPNEDELAIRAGQILARRLRHAQASGPRREWQPHGTVLVTGGDTPLGRRTAAWLTDIGAENVMLIDDVPDEQGLRKLIANLDLPLRTVIHTASVLDDATIDTATDDQLRRVLQAKVDAAFALHRATESEDLAAFVLFSSIGGSIGIAGQATYAPGNAVLDALAVSRRAQGLPATAIAWGHWALDDQVIPNRAGIRDLDPDVALAALRQALDHDETTIAVCDVDWAVLAGPNPPPILRELVVNTDIEQDDLRTRLAEQDKAGQRRLVLAVIIDATASVLRHGDNDTVDPRRGFREQGFDSLAAIRFRNQVNAATGLRLPMTVAFDHPSPNALADHVLAELAVEPDHDDIAAASDEEIIDLLEREFGIS